jgi:hypothetical protein
MLQEVLAAAALQVALPSVDDSGDFEMQMVLMNVKLEPPGISHPHLTFECSFHLISRHHPLSSFIILRTGH